MSNLKSRELEYKPKSSLLFWSAPAALNTLQLTDAATKSHWVSNSRQPFVLTALPCQKCSSARLSFVHLNQTYVNGIKLPMFIWTVREASFSKILGSHSRSGIFSSKISFETEHRTVHSNYVREHRRCGTSIFSACQLRLSMAICSFKISITRIAQE